MITTEDFLDRFNDFIDEIREEQYSFERSELGVHANSEDRYSADAISATTYIEDLVEEHGIEKAIEMAGIHFDGEFDFSINEDLALEEYKAYFDANIKRFNTKEKLKKYSSYSYFNENFLDLLVNFDDDIDEIMVQEKSISNEEEYLDVFLKRIHKLIETDYELSKLEKSCIDVMVGQEKELIVTKLTKDEEYKNSYSLLRNVKSSIEMIKQIERKLNMDEPNNDVNNEVWRCINNEDGYINNDINSLIMRHHENDVYEEVIEKISDLFNKDTLKINHFFKNIDRMVKSEICVEERKTSRTRYMHNNNNNKKEEVNKHYQNARISIKFYQEYSNLIKSNKENFKIEEIQTIEEMYDNINKLVVQSDLNKVIKKLIGSYDHLMSDENTALIKQMLENKMNMREVKEDLSNIALIEDKSDLAKTLLKILNQENDGVISLNSLERKIRKEGINAKIVHKSDRNDSIGVVLGDVDAAHSLAPSSWCIAKNKMHFDSYKKSGENVLIYDFSKDDKDLTSIIGISVDRDNKIRNMFNKNNMSITSKTDFFSKIASVYDSSLSRHFLTKEVEEVNNGVLKIENAIDPVFIIRSLQSNEFDKNMEKLVEVSLNKSTLPKSEVLRNIKMIDRSRPNIDLLNFPCVKDYLKSVEDPVSFLESKEKFSKSKSKLNNLKM